MLKKETFKQENELGSLGDKFNDLIKEYKERDYIIPTFTQHDNLFKLSPLLEENEEIYEIFKLIDINKEFERDIHYLKKISIESKNQLLDSENMRRKNTLVLDTFFKSRNREYLSNRVESLLKKIKEEEVELKRAQSALKHNEESSYEFKKEDMDDTMYHSKRASTTFSRRKLKMKKKLYNIVIPKIDDLDGSYLSTIGSVKEKNNPLTEHRKQSQVNEMNILTNLSVKNQEWLIKPTVKRIQDLQKNVRMFNLMNFERESSICKTKTFRIKTNKENKLKEMCGKAENAELEHLRKEFLYYLDNLSQKKEVELILMKEKWIYKKKLQCERKFGDDRSVKKEIEEYWLRTSVQKSTGTLAGKEDQEHGCKSEVML